VKNASVVFVLKRRKKRTSAVSPGLQTGMPGEPECRLPSQIRQPPTDLWCTSLESRKAFAPKSLPCATPKEHDWLAKERPKRVHARNPAVCGNPSYCFREGRLASRWQRDTKLAAPLAALFCLATAVPGGLPFATKSRKS
jgi:hypothetical protein